MCPVLLEQIFVVHVGRQRHYELIAFIDECLCQNVYNLVSTVSAYDDLIVTNTSIVCNFSHQLLKLGFRISVY